MIKGGNAETIFANHLKNTIKDADLVLDIGTSQRFAKELRPYEHWFLGKNYIAAGYKPQSIYGKYNCDCHQDIHDLTFVSNTFDAVICIEVLEHVVDPFQAIRELTRVLKPGGKLLLTTPFLTTYHGKGFDTYTAAHECYPDFWRFTHQGLSHLFKSYQSSTILPLDGPIELRLKEFYLTKYLSISAIRKLVDFIDNPRNGKATTRHLVYAVK